MRKVIVTMPPARLYAMAVSLLLLSLATGCSDSTSPEMPGQTAELSVIPRSGAPGTVVLIENLDISKIEMDSLQVWFGDRQAPVIPSRSGGILSAIPLFLDSLGVHVPPTLAVDVILIEAGNEIGRIEAAVTILPLPQAPGAGVAAAEGMRRIAAALRSIMDLLVISPSREEQQTAGMLAALDSLLGDTPKSSLGSALAALESEPSRKSIAEGLLETIHAGDRLANTAASLENIAGQMAASGGARRDATGQQRAPCEFAGAALLVSDNLLALKMQFYVLAAGFGEQVIAETGQTFAETIGLAAGLVGIVHSLPQVEVTLVILAYIDFVVNKVIVGLLPSNLDAIDLDLAEIELGFLSPTNSTITVHASNTPPQISLQYMIGQVLTLMGASGSSEAIESFRQILVRTANYFLSTMQGVIASYSTAHPELNLDVDLLSIVPTIAWTATASNPVFYNLRTFTPDIVEPIEGELNWMTGEQAGIGRIYLMPSSSQEARLLPGYYGGAFGDESVASNVRSILVGADIELEIQCPGAMDPGDTGEMMIRAGYRGAESVDWTSGIEVTIEAQGGSVAPASGQTDVDGYFGADIMADYQESGEILLVIEARGDNGRFAGATVEIAVGRGLPAVYSNGIQAVEGPINHGWSNLCGGEPYMNNMYQGACAPRTSPPLDWAWENEFWVYWSGYIFAPLEGTYSFSGWVDGNVIVEVNGTRIARIETTGGGYSGSTALPAGAWVPIFMYFEANGGSNNMILRWRVPGAAGSEIVPRKYLNDMPGEASPEQPALRPGIRIFRTI